MDRSPASLQQKPLSLVKETLTQQICGLLKSKIINGELVAGNRIWADDLADSLGVSIAPVKEALLILSGEGLINNIPRRGSVVRSFSLVEMRELYDVRRLLEIEALELMFKKSLVEDEFVANLDTINQQIGELRVEGEFTDRNAAFELDWQFHQQFMRNCTHGLLIELYSRLNTQAQIIRYASWNIGPRGDKTYNEHAAIVSGLARRSLSDTRQAIVDHLQSILEDFDRAISINKSMEKKMSEDGDVLPGGRRKSR